MTPIETVLVTPELAEEWLSRNYQLNRTINWVKVREYAGDMESGRWNETIANPIRFTKDGTLIDGQQRLSAVVESGCSILMYVQKDLSIDDFNYIDIGAKRKAADFIRGEKSAKSLAAVSRMTYATKKGTANLQGILHGYLSITPREQPSVPCIIRESQDALVQECYVQGRQIREAMKCGADSVFGYGVWLLKWLGDPDSKDSVNDYVADFTALQHTRASTAVCANWLRNSVLAKKKVTKEDQLTLFLYGYECFATKRNLKVYQPNNGITKKYDALIKRAREKAEESK